MFADGTFCRLIHATTLLQGAPNAVTLEFTTPRIAAAAPQGVLACLTSQGASFTSQSPLALRSGGTQFDIYYDVIIHTYYLPCILPLTSQAPLSLTLSSWLSVC